MSIITASAITSSVIPAAVAQLDLVLSMMSSMERDVMELLTVALLGFHVRGPDYFAPLLRFISNEPGEVSGPCAAQIGKANLHLGIDETQIDFSVEQMRTLMAPTNSC